MFLDNQSYAQYIGMPEKFPKDKTYKDLLRNMGTDSLRRSDQFLRVNARYISDLDFTDQKIQLFWDCMALYDVYGENYFSGIVELFDLSAGFEGPYGPFDGGIDTWFEEEPNRFAHSKEKFLRLVNLLHFFELESFQGIPFSAFEERAKTIDAIMRQVEDRKAEERRLKKQLNTEQKVERYFNFGDFSETDFQKYLDRLLKNQQSGKLSIDQVLGIAKNFPQNTYIMTFETGGAVSYIGKTTRLLDYLGEIQKKTGADHVSFADVDPAYVDDLLAAFQIACGYSLSKDLPTSANRKYGALSNAIFAYERSENIRKKTVMKAIQDSGLPIYDVFNGKLLVDKLALHRVLFPGTDPGRDPQKQ